MYLMKHKVMLLLLIATLSFVWAVPREMVVLEIGTGTWCPYCPGASMGAHDLLEAGYNVAVVKNHNGDPYANTFSNTRNTYYGINSFPTATFDGLNGISGGSNTASMFSSYLPRVTARLAVPSKYTITAEGSLEGNVLSVDVTVSKPEDDTNTGVYLRSYLTESAIMQNWQGQTRLDNVNRSMAPNATGTPINLATGESTTVTLTFQINDAWQVPNLELVLFLQNNSSKEILQGKKYNVPGLTGAFPASTQNLVFPDTYVTGFSTKPITFYNYGDNPVTASIASNNPLFIPDVTTITIPSTSSRVVNVSYAPTATGTSTGILTVTGNFNQHPVLEITLTGNAFINTAPVAEDVVINGPPVINQDVVAVYTFTDLDDNTEGNSQYQWYQVAGETLVPIEGANATQYRIQAEDLGYPLVFGVTPVDQHGMPGAEALSAETPAIVDLPTPQNFSGVLQPPNTVVLSWEKPQYYDTRGFVGYRIFRNGLNISTITNPNTLTFTDLNVADGEYEYYICSLFTNPQGLSAPSPSVLIEIGNTSNEDQVAGVVYSVSTMPNPFVATTNFQIDAKANQSVRFSVYNLKGQQVKSWESQIGNSGNLTISWDGSDSRGKQTDSGIYLYRLETSGKVLSGKIIKVSK